MDKQANNEEQQDDLFADGVKESASGPKDEPREVAKEENPEEPKPKGMKKPKKKATNNSLYYVTDFSGMLSIMASGLIRPSVADRKLSCSLNGLCSSRLLLWNRAVPRNVVYPPEQVSGDESIVIEIDAAALKGTKLPVLDEKLEVSDGFISRVKKDLLCLLPGGVITQSCLRSVYLLDSNAIEDLKVRMEMMSNFCISELSYRSFDELDVGEEICLDTFKTRIGELRPCSFFDNADCFKRVNSLGGAIVLGPTHIPPNSAWLDALFSVFQSIIQKKRKVKRSAASTDEYLSDLVSYVLAADGDTSGFSAKLAEVSMFHSAVHFLCNLSPSDGLDLSDFIKRIAGECKEHGLPPEELEKVAKWREYSLELTQAQARPPALGDNPNSLFRRAISLFILRPNVERLLQSRSSSLQPGDQVFFLALVLAGLYEGYSRVDKDIKKNSRTNEIAVNSVAALLNQSANEKFECFPPNTIEAQIDDSRHDDITQLRSVLVNGHIVASVSVGPGDAMRGLYGRARSQGYNLEYDLECDSFHYSFQYEEDRSQKVYISITEGELHHGKEMIRFASPCRDISGKGKLSASEMQEILCINASRHMHCRFAVDDENNQLLVAVDQLLATNDWEEFEFFCAEVARVADEYERKFGQDKY